MVLDLIIKILKAIEEQSFLETEFVLFKSENCFLNSFKVKIIVSLLLEKFFNYFIFICPKKILAIITKEKNLGIK